MKSIVESLKFRFVNFLALLLITANEIRAQIPLVPAPTPAKENRVPLAQNEDFTWWYISLLLLGLCLVGALLWLTNKRKEDKNIAEKSKVQKISADLGEMNSADIDKELERFRKKRKVVKNGTKSAVRTRNNEIVAQQQVLQSVQEEEVEKSLPVFSIEKLELARPFAPLPISNDEALMSAIEQTHDEFEEDEEIREIALRILSAFKTRNSVEALSQMALYDLSSNLRSKAVTILSEFNHESVFEPVLQATADPTREVRAAAARAMSKLTFDRADAWTRIFESEEEGRMIQAARAATESGFVQMSFDRLAHPDEKYSYEALTLMALLIKAGETDEIFRVLENHKDINVRKAILHVIKITKDQRALDELYLMLEKKSLPLAMQEEIDKTIEEIGFVTV